MSRGIRTYRFVSEKNFSPSYSSDRRDGPSFLLILENYVSQYVVKGPCLESRFGILGAKIFDQLITRSPILFTGYLFPSYSPVILRSDLYFSYYLASDFRIYAKMLLFFWLLQLSIAVLAIPGRIKPREISTPLSPAAAPATITSEPLTTAKKKGTSMHPYID